MILHVTFEEEKPVDSSPDPAKISILPRPGQDVGKVGKAGVFSNTTLEVTDAPNSAHESFNYFRVDKF